MKYLFKGLIKFTKMLNRFKHRLKLNIYVCAGSNIDKTVMVYGDFEFIGKSENISIGKNSTINSGVVFNARCPINIGKNVHISTGVKIHTAKLNLSNFSEHLNSSVNIGNNVWIASNVVIGPGVNISDNVVIAANSYVNKDLSANGLYAGSPAIRKRNLL